MLPPENKDYIIRKIIVNNKSFFDIENENMCYATFGESHHGLQCDLEYNSDDYKKIMNACSDIVKKIKEIDAILYGK